VVIAVEFYKAVGEVIREQRLASMLTLRQLSGKSSVSMSYLCEVERGDKQPSSQILEALAGGLGLNAYEIILEAGLKMYRESTPKTLYVPDLTAWAEQYSDLTVRS
jgi:transcriptional regulator with XRE-family HTH domain